MSSKKTRAKTGNRQRQTASRRPRKKTKSNGHQAVVDKKRQFENQDLEEMWDDDYED